MKPYLRLPLAALLALLVAFTLAACGDDEESSSSSSEKPAATAAASTVIESDPANASKGTITIGSKNFTEQFILGNIYAQTLEALGFKVKRRLNLGDAQIAFKALKSGQIDAYPEYTGTALLEFFGVKTKDLPKDPDEAYEQVKAGYAKEDLTALPRTPFENTYVVASTAATAEKAGNPKTLSELLPKSKELGFKISGFPECRQRLDCLVGLRQTYGYNGGFVASEGRFNDLDQGTSELTLAFGTDPQLALTDKYVAYDDDKKFYPPYNVTLGVRNDAIEKIGPKGQEKLLAVQKGMTEEAMRELNRRVDLEKQTAEAVATAYLKESGFIK